MHVLWARWGVGGGARTLLPQPGVCLLVWALGAPPAARVAWVAPLRVTSEARRSFASGCPPLGGCRGPPPTCCGGGCAGVGAQHCPLVLHALWGLHAAGEVAVPALALQRGALASCRCALWGRRKGVPGGVAFRRRGERLSSGASPFPAAHLRGGLPGAATRVLCGCASVGAQHCPLGSPAPCWAACRGGGGGLSPGWVAFHCSDGRLVSGAVPPPAPRPLGRRPGFRHSCVLGAVGVVAPVPRLASC